MSALASTPSRWNVAAVIARREASAMVRSISGYIALTVALIAATWILLVDVRALESGGLLAVADPLGPALTMCMMVLAIFLGVSAAVSVARDREAGTLEVLFYGPVDEASYIAGKVGGLLMAYAAALTLLFASFTLLALMTGFSLTEKILIGLVLSVVPAAEIIGFGALLSVGTSRVRTAVLLLLAVIAVLLGVAVAYKLVLLVPIDDPASPVLPLRDVLALLDTGVRWLSPFAYLESVVDGVAKGAWRTAFFSLAAALIYAVVIMGLAAVWLRRRGVERKGD